MRSLFSRFITGVGFALFGLWAAGGLRAVHAAVPAAIDIPPPPAASWAVFPEMKLAGVEQARALFKPMGGSPEVRVFGPPSRQAFLLSCNFSGTKHERASWDLGIQADLAVARGIQFYFYCADSSPVASFVAYFHSGAGWYRAGFALPGDGRWHRVVIDKSATNIEDEPAGWGRVDAIRISAWRGKDRDTSCAIAAVGPLGTDADVLILRADSAAASGDRGLAQYAEVVGAALAALDVPYALVSDLDVTRERLADRSLVILPYNPAIPDDVLERLREFVSHGGKLMACYTSNRAIFELLQIGPGKWLRAEGGHFQGFVRTSDRIPGFPAFVPQGSWNAQLATPIEGKSWVQAVWRDAQGFDTKYPAILASDTGVYISHVLLSDGGEAKNTMILALLGRYVPGLWERAARARFQNIGVFADYPDFDAFRRDMAQQKYKKTWQRLGKVIALRKQAEDMLAREQWLKAIRLSGQAADEAMRTWCMARTSRPGEHRAFWCHSAFGLPGKTWDESIKFLAEHGFNAILPNMLWGGVAYYRSAVLPVYKEIDKRGDQLELCVDACHKYGVECHVWKVNFNMGSRTSPEFVAAMKKAGRVQVTFDGQLKERWLCPSNPENQELEIRSMVEVARMYPVDGIHFDYIRYPGRQCCFCAGCRKRFEAQIGRRVADWPGAIRKDAELQKQWLDFRRGNINRVVSEVSRQARAVRPGIKISAAVFRNWPVDRDGVGQDWKLWCDQGWLDAVCPMDYTPSNTTFENMVTAQLEYAGKVPCYPGIGLSTWRDPNAIRLIQQIEITRRLGTGGFTVFNYDPHAVEVLPFCSLGITATK